MPALGTEQTWASAPHMSANRTVRFLPSNVGSTKILHDFIIAKHRLKSRVLVAMIIDLNGQTTKREYFFDCDEAIKWLEAEVLLDRHNIQCVELYADNKRLVWAKSLTADSAGSADLFRRQAFK